MKIIRVIEAKRWKNSKTGATASLYGSVPWSRESDRQNWHIESNGWTWENSNGTIGLGRVPAKTKAEALAIMENVNARHNRVRGRSSRRGKIRIDRKAYTRRAFTRADGTRVPATRVAASRFSISDPGRKGRRARGSEHGPFRNQPKWIQRSGELGGKGFTTKATGTRRTLLARSAKKYGYRATLGKLQAILRNTELHANTRRTLTADRHWLVEHFGGPGSFSRAPRYPTAAARRKTAKRYSRHVRSRR